MKEKQVLNHWFSIFVSHFRTVMIASRIGIVNMNVFLLKKSSTFWEKVS
jgi:hypothetical protein